MTGKNIYWRWYHKVLKIVNIEDTQLKNLKRLLLNLIQLHDVNVATLKKAAILF